MRKPDEQIKREQDSKTIKMLQGVINQVKAGKWNRQMLIMTLDRSDGIYKAGVTMIDIDIPEALALVAVIKSQMLIQMGVVKKQK